MLPSKPINIYSLQRIRRLIILPLWHIILPGIVQT